MSNDYNSFQIKNTNDVPLLLSVRDPDGSVRTVGKVAPGQKSLQVAPLEAAWSVEGLPVEIEERPAPSAPPQPIRPAPDPRRVEVKVEGIPPSEHLNGSEMVPYKAFLKIESGSHTARINQLLVTPDGRSLITSGEDKTIRIWDIETREQRSMLLGQIGSGEEGMLKAMSLSRDKTEDGRKISKYLVALAWMYPGGRTDLERETDVRVYELATGNLQAYFRYPGTLYDLDFSPDGQSLVMVGNPKDTVRQGYVMVYHANDILNATGQAPAAVASQALYDFHLLRPAYVRCIPDPSDKSTGCQIVVASWYDTPKCGGVSWFSFTVTGDRGTLENTARCDSPVMPEGLAVSREFAVVTGDSGREFELKRTLYCYDHQGNLRTQVPSDSRPVKPAFSQNGKQLIVGQSSDGTLIQMKAQGSVQVKVYEVVSDQFLLKSTYYGHDSEVFAVGFLLDATSADTADSTALSAGGDQNEIHFWKTTHIEGERTGVIKGMGRVVHAVGLKESENEVEQIGFGNRNYLVTPDGNLLLPRAFDLRSKILSSLSYQESQAFRRAKTQLGELQLEWREADTYPNLWLLYSGGGRTALTGTWDEHIKAFSWYKPLTFGFTDNLTIVTGDSEGKVRVAPQHGDQTYATLPWRVLVGHTARVLDHATCGKWLVTAGADQVIRLWYLEDVEQDVMTDLEPALNLFVGADDEWVLWSKSGYYMASQNGDRYLGYHVNRGSDKEALFFSSDRFHSVFYRPDIIQAILTYGSEERASQKTAESKIPIPPVKVEDILPPIIELERDGAQVYELGDTKDGFVSFTLTARSPSPKKQIARLCVLRNGRLIHFERSLPANPKMKITISQVRLLPGNNHFKIFAENQDAESHAIKSNPIEQTILGKGRYSDQDLLENGTLYILAIGVSQGIHLVKRESAKEGDTPELNYAHIDADAIKNIFDSNKAFEGVEGRLLINEQATRKDILAALDQIDETIRRKVEERVMKRENAKRDVLLVFLSGHGMYRIPTQQLYFWNYDLDLENPVDTGLSFIEVGEKIASLPAEVILMTDACHSGMAGSDVAKGFDGDQQDGVKALDSEHRDIDPDELARRIYGINETDMYIFNAAGRAEYAGEGPSVEHGYFTKAILDTLLESTDPGVTMLGLIDQVQWRVPKYKPGQHPVCRMYGDLLPLNVYQK